MTFLKIINSFLCFVYKFAHDDKQTASFTNLTFIQGFSEDTKIWIVVKGISYVR